MNPRGLTSLAPRERRLIEDLLPIEAINAVAQREKIGHAGLHPRKLHLWWARRPLAAARAAVYATLVRADEGRRTPDDEAAFFDALCLPFRRSADRYLPNYRAVVRRLRGAGSRRFPR